MIIAIYPRFLSSFKLLYPQLRLKLSKARQPLLTKEAEDAKYSVLSPLSPSPLVTRQSRIAPAFAFLASLQTIFSSLKPKTVCFVLCFGQSAILFATPLLWTFEIAQSSIFCHLRNSVSCLYLFLFFYKSMRFYSSHR